MSGIYGYLLKDKEENQILSSLKKWHLMYGKDAREEIDLGIAGMGCAIFHIPKNVPVDSPVLRKNQYCAVIDALIYNRDELAEMLPNDDIACWSDEKLLFEIFLAHGANGLRNVNGDFAGAVYDGETLTLFRDHLGIRPIYWYRDEKMVAFGTDMRGILAIPGIDKSLNEPYLYANLTGYLMDESEITDFQNLRAVSPGSTVRIDPALSYEKKFYWRIGEKKIRLGSEQEYIGRMRELVYDAIRRRMQVAAGQKIGAELSGGMDSSVIDVIIKELGTDPVCYSWAPELADVPLQHHDEREIIEKTCSQFGLKCTYGFRQINETEQHYTAEQYKFPPEVYNPFVTSTAQFFGEKKIPIIFSGWGGDEGVSHRNNIFELWYAREWKEYLAFQWKRCRGKKKPLRFMKLLYRNLIIDRQYFLSPWNLYKANRLEIPSILNDSFGARWAGKAPVTADYFAYDSIKQIESGANRGRIETCSITGAMNGVQYVFPFLDYRVEDYAVSIPRHLYVNLKDGYRVIYKKSFREQMIPELYNYIYKDDPGRMMAMWETYASEEGLDLKLANTIRELDWTYWDQYLNREKLERYIAEATEDDKYLFSDKLERCLQIQVLQRAE